MTAHTVSIAPKAMSLHQAALFFEALDYTGRQEFYKDLLDDEKDALYMQITDRLIGRVPVATKAQIDRDANEWRHQPRTEAQATAENDCMWRAAAWYIVMGHASNALMANLKHMQPHFDALGATE